MEMNLELVLQLIIVLNKAGRVVEADRFYTLMLK